MKHVIRLRFFFSQRAQGLMGQRWRTSLLGFIGALMIPVRVVNVDDKTRVIKEGEVLATCAPFTCINQSLQATIIKSSDALISEIFQNAELNPEQRSAAEKLLIEFKNLFSRTSGDVGRTKET